MTTLTKKNAKVISTHLGYEDHGILTFYLYLDYGGTSQGAGGIALSGGTPTKFMDFRILSDILGTVGVEHWEDLRGRSVVALLDGDGWDAQVRGLENFLGTKQMLWEDYK